ncbi:MAG: hypothetical protein HWQ38_04260 [Nostoc sp. NMS7]|uniref:hypothetical protein n=1 Tax=Nostoc sp. NMS7 TaxID=2815391 RepID=UPI0025F467E9|nr:hypothetical protein [Nostoc sp. NMS7]MBN3945725.1 hypothetical protein [Nostoc sp. NMS7]
MTYQIYSQQQLQLKSIARLKQIYNEIACTVEVSDKRCKDAWISAIVNYQASKIQKLAPTALDEQASAQAELDSYIAYQAQAIAPEPLTIGVQRGKTYNNFLLRSSTPLLKSFPALLKTKSWRISSTSARITGLKFSMMAFTTTTA